MKVVKVYGALRERLGRCRFEFEAETPAQALKALCVNFPGLDKWLVDSEAEGIGYRVSLGKEKIPNDPSLLMLPWSEREVFSITPVIAGAGGGGGGGLGQVFVGIGLVALAIVAGPAAGGFLGLGAGLGATAATAGTAAAAGLIGGAAASAIGFIGLSLIAGGVSNMISPQPGPVGGLAGAERGREAARFESTGFSNVVNTTQQGLPVPIAYGRVFVGSAVLSSGLDVVQKKG